MPAMVVSVNLAVPQTAEWAGDFGATGIDKRPVAGPVLATALGLVGDHVVDTRKHGGIDQAIYAYAAEDAAWWAAELGRDVAPGSFGENLTVRDVNLTEALIGERWRVGAAVVEVSRPRTPCRVLAAYWDVADLIIRFTERATPGAYLRVVEEGDIAAGDTIEVIHRPTHEVTVGMVFRAITTEPELLPRILEVPELTAKDRDKAVRRLAPPFATGADQAF